jgi:hypothetical protein
MSWIKIETPEWGESKDGRTSLVVPYNVEFTHAFWKLRSGWPRRDAVNKPSSTRVLELMHLQAGSEWSIADRRVDEVDALLREHFDEVVGCAQV